MNFNKAEFVRSYGEYSQLPPSDRLELALSLIHISEPTRPY